MNIQKIDTENFCTQCHAGINKHLGAYLMPVLKSDSKLYCNCCGTVYNIKNSLASIFEEKYEIDKEGINQLRAFIENKLMNENVNTQALIMPLIWSLYDESKDYLNSINKTLIYSSDPLFLNFGIHALAMSIGVRIHLQFANISDIHETYKREINQALPVQRPFSIIILENEYEGKTIHKSISPAEVTYLCVKDLRKIQDRALAYPKVFSLI